jgi:hypothetical protein
VNDFLTRVVQRHRGEVPTVRPRLAPLFAPGVEPAADQLSEEVAWSQPATTRTLEPTSTGTPEHRATPTVQAESLISPPRLPIVNRVVEVPSQVGRPGGESASEAPGRQVPAQERRPVNEERQPGPERTVPSPSAPPEPPAASHAVTTLTQRMVTERLTRTERVEVIPRLVRQDISPARSIEAPPSLVAAPDSRGRLDGIDPDTAEPPVQVTIGRIEVTAIAAPPAPKRKTASRQPSMSLQEYLARRQDKGVSR